MLAAIAPVEGSGTTSMIRNWGEAVLDFAVIAYEIGDLRRVKRLLSTLLSAAVVDPYHRPQANVLAGLVDVAQGNLLRARQRLDELSPCCGDTCPTENSPLLREQVLELRGHLAAARSVPGDEIDTLEELLELREARLPVASASSLVDTLVRLVSAHLRAGQIDAARDYFRRARESASPAERGRPHGDALAAIETEIRDVVRVHAP